MARSGITFPFKAHIGFKARIGILFYIATLSGQVTLSGSGVSGAIIKVVRESDNVIVQTTTTDGSGNYSLTGYGISGTETYHLMVEYTDGGAVKYNAKSTWRVAPAISA